jgi:hypothetical protein
VFDHLRIRGTAASILWGYRPAAVLKSWSIVRVKTEWRLTATIERVEPFMIRQGPLLFTAPREHARDGMWAWGVHSVQVGTHQLIARLGPPEQ